MELEGDAPDLEVEVKVNFDIPLLCVRMFRQYNWILIKIPYRVDRFAAGGGEIGIGKVLLGKEMRIRMSVPCVLHDLTPPIWVSCDSTADEEKVHMTVLPLLPDLAQYF